MRDFAYNLIKKTASKLGLPEGSVFIELEDERKENVMLPSTRLEVQFLDEDLIRQGWRVGRLREESGHVLTRWSRYRSILSVRTLYRSDDQSKVDDFCRRILISLPGRIKDAAGNWVRVEAQRAVREGYTFASIRVEEKPLQALHLSFTSIIYKDVETDFIENIRLKSSFNGEKI